MEFLQKIIGTKYRISNVINFCDEDTSGDYSYRIGRLCTIERLEVGFPLILTYENDECCVTSQIQKIAYVSDGLTVHTCNREYAFTVVV